MKWLQKKEILLTKEENGTERKEDWGENVENAHCHEQKAVEQSVKRNKRGMSQRGKEKYVILQKQRDM